MNRFLLGFFFLVYSLSIKGQTFGGFPPTTKWQQINTDTARVIFTPGAARQAQRIATLLHRMAGTVTPLGEEMKKINIVLHSNTTLANGYVGLGPFRSEFYLVPGGNIFQFGNLPWEEQLVIHEYRHVQQYNNFNRGGSKALGFLFGQEGRAVANALAVPDWFFEGDAVYAETVLTPQGRGRMPYFLNGYNSLWKEGRQYPWMKLRNGSLKDFVPSHYQLGYLLVNYGYLKHGPGFWKKVTQDAAAYRGLLYPFQQAVKRHSGVDFKTFREQGLKYYSHEVSRRRIDQQGREDVMNYFYPQQISADSLLYLKRGYKRLPGFYIRDKKGEHRISRQNISADEWFSYKNGTIAYTAYGTNKRWALIDYSNIILLNIRTKEEEVITRKGKYFSPDLSPDNEKLIAVSVTDSLKNELHWLTRKGDVLKKIPAPVQSFFVQPRFVDENTIVVGVRWPDATMSLEKIDLLTEKGETLIPPTANTIGFPFVQDGTVYFTASLSANDDIFALDLKDKKLYQLTTGQTGHYFPSVFGDSLTWASFTSNGYRLQQKAMKELERTEVNLMQVQEETLPFEIAQLSSASNLLATPEKRYSVKRYKKTTGLFNFHSWRPDYEDPEFTFSLYGNNVLNTFSSELYYRYNQNERSHSTGFNASYGGLFPVLATGLQSTFNREVEISGRTFLLNQAEARAGYAVPLNFTGGKTAKFFNGGSNYVISRLMPTGELKNFLSPQTTSYLHHFISWREQLPRARQHIYPKFGYASGLSYRHRLDKKGYQSLGVAQVYLPSLFINHSLVADAGFQQVDTGNVLFSNRFANARGYPNFFFSKMWKVGVNYHFPLVYPDFGLANIAYLMRVRSNVFYDFSKVYAKDRRRNLDLRSVGGELFFDTKWWNQLPLTLGLRYSYLLDAALLNRKNPHRFEFIIPIDIIPD